MIKQPKSLNLNRILNGVRMIEMTLSAYRKGQTLSYSAMHVRSNTFPASTTKRVWLELSKLHFDKSRSLSVSRSQWSEKKRLLSFNKNMAKRILLEIL